MSLSLSRTLALCAKYRVSKLSFDDDDLVVEFFPPSDVTDAKSAPKREKSTNPADHARSPEVEAAVAALDRAYNEIEDDAPEHPERDVKAIIAAIEAAKAGE